MKMHESFPSPFLALPLPVFNRGPVVEPLEKILTLQMLIGEFYHISARKIDTFSEVFMTHNYRIQRNYSKVCEKIFSMWCESMRFIKNAPLYVWH
jgi:hypothetical protein